MITIYLLTPTHGIAVGPVSFSKGKSDGEQVTFDVKFDIYEVEKDEHGRWCRIARELETETILNQP